MSHVVTGTMSAVLISFMLLTPLNSGGISSGFLLVAWTLFITSSGKAVLSRTANLSADISPGMELFLNSAGSIFWAKESAAVFAGVATRILTVGSLSLSSLIISTRVWDFPVPGGPCRIMGAVP